MGRRTWIGREAGVQPWRDLVPGGALERQVLENKKGDQELPGCFGLVEGLTLAVLVQEVAEKLLICLIMHPMVRTRGEA